MADADGARLEAARRDSRRLTHRAGANFSVGFRFLPEPRRRAVYAAYAFCRKADDAVDEGDPAGAPARLAEWADELEATYAGRPATGTGAALAEALTSFPIPKAAFEGLIAGCRQDLERTRYETFDDLLGYCDLVATTISTISLAIFGGLGEAETEARGRDLATALQLTNVIRDVGEDAGRGRIYLPRDEMATFGVFEADLISRRATPAYGALLRFEADRALGFFRRAEPVKDLVDRECRFGVTMMGGIYAEVAALVRARPAETLERRIGLTTFGKLRAVARRLVTRRFVLPLAD